MDDENQFFNLDSESDSDSNASSESTFPKFKDMKPDYTNVTIHPDAFVTPRTMMRGHITIGARTKILDYVSILADDGPIEIGIGNYIRPNCVIMNKVPHKLPKPEKEQKMVIGNYNIIKKNCKIRSLHIGDRNIIRKNCYIGYGVDITENCEVDTDCKLKKPEVLPPYRYIFLNEFVNPDKAVLDRA